jgi:hypothetical protein
MRLVVPFPYDKRIKMHLNDTLDLEMSPSTHKVGLLYYAII